MKDAKVEIKHDGMRVTKFSINETDLTNAPITTININIQGGEKPKVLVEFDADEIKVNGDYEVIKKLPSEEHGTEIVIKGNKVATDVKVEDLAKAIMKNFNKSSYR